MSQASLFDSRKDPSVTRLFALDPTTKGFGYVIFDLPFRLVEWGLAHVAGDKFAGAISRFEELLARFRPDKVVLEDATAPGSRRRPRVRRLLEGLLSCARERGVAVTEIARSAVIKCFAPSDGHSAKHAIAERLAQDFPEIRERLPRRRKPWHSENEGMAIFDALALAVTYATT